MNNREARDLASAERLVTRVNGKGANKRAARVGIQSVARHILPTIKSVDQLRAFAVACDKLAKQARKPAKLTGMGVKADKACKARYGIATKRNPSARPPETYVIGWNPDGSPITREVVDTAARVMLPGERGTIKRNRSQPRSAASKRGGVGAKNKLRASAMVESFLRDANNQARELASAKATRVIAHFAGVDVDALPRKQRQSARRALRKATANL